MNIIRAGSTLYLTEVGGPHLWVVLTDPTGEPPWVLTVCLNTKKKHSDDTVVLQPDDHPFIQWETSVSYSSARARRVDRIIHRMGQGKCDLKEDMDSAVLRRIQEGLKSSHHTVKAILAQWVDHLPG